jgi:hypothetical protein
MIHKEGVPLLPPTAEVTNSPYILYIRVVTTVFLPVANILSTETCRMSRNAFIGDTLKYRKPRFKPDCMITPQVRYDRANPE